MPDEPLTVFYDGLCPLCSREVAHYRRRAPAGAMQFVDIAAPDFDAPRHGLDAARVRQVFHVRRGGTLLTGVEAFIAIWEVLGYRRLAWLARRRGVHGLLRAGYRLFAAVRPWLPRRQCAAGVCQRA